VSLFVPPYKKTDAEPHGDRQPSATGQRATHLLARQPREVTLLKTDVSYLERSLAIGLI